MGIYTTTCPKSSPQSSFPSPSTTLGNHPGFGQQFCQTIPHAKKTQAQRNWCPGMLLYPTSCQQSWRTPTILCHQCHRQGLEVLESQTSSKTHSSSSTVAFGIQLDARSSQAPHLSCTHDQQYNTTLQTPSPGVIFTKYPSVMDSLCNHKDSATRWADGESPICACSTLRQHSHQTPPADQHLIVDGDTLHFTDKPLTSIATGSLQNKIFPPSKEIYKSLREALTMWTKKNSLPWLTHSDLEELWTRSIQTHHASIHDHITHKDITRFNNSSPTLFFTTRASGPLLFEYSAQWSTMNVSPRPSPTRWFSGSSTPAQTTSSRTPSPRSANNLARLTPGPLVLDAISRTPTSSQNARNSSAQANQSSVSSPHLFDPC